MDTYREHPRDFDLPSEAEATPADDVTAAIGTDERRMHVRAYNYWVSLLEGRDFPSIEDLEPGNVQDFADNSLLLDFTCGRDNPAMPYIGSAIRDECGLDDGMRTIADVPSRSLLSRLTDHYMQIVANRAPVGFEAEFENQRGENISYRGILMPFSSDGEAIDFIYGVINWKAVPTAAAEPVAAVAVAAIDEETPVRTEDELVLSDDPVEPEDEAEYSGNDAELEEEASLPEQEPVADDDAGPTEIEAVEEQPEDAESPAHFSWEDGPLADEDDVPHVTLDDSAGLADRLSAARETAQAVKAGEGRTRAALYKALSLAYDFALAAADSPEDYSELLEESGVRAQARAPMTPIVKLVFGIDYDKARLTEFAAALSFGLRQQVGLGAFQEFIDKQAGGLKALVAAEREARRPEARTDSRTEAARRKLRQATPISLADLPGDAEFALVLTRRGPDGRYEPVAVVADETLIDRAIRRSA